ncbi:hypothetical protein YB2330_001654 [Saitoella coloradoensis]
MTKAGTQTRVTYTAKSNTSGTSETYIIFVESKSAVDAYRASSSTPLVDVVNSFDIFVTHKHGKQGTLDHASKSQLENEFGTSKPEEAIVKILKEGEVQATHEGEKEGNRNASIGSLGGH